LIVPLAAAIRELQNTRILAATFMVATEKNDMIRRYTVRRSNHVQSRRVQRSQNVRSLPKTKRDLPVVRDCADCKSGVGQFSTTGSKLRKKVQCEVMGTAFTQTETHWASKDSRQDQSSFRCSVSCVSCIVHHGVPPCRSSTCPLK
jgi:hypothetical protein